MIVGARTVTVNNPQKVYFPADGITKQDVLEYYRTVARAMVPHLRNRPVMLARYPDGIGGPGFYQKDLPATTPRWVKRVTVRKEGGIVHHALCNDAATLVYLAELGTITPHVWLSRVPHLRVPDRIIVDLDPSGTATFRDVCFAAEQLRRGFLRAKLVPFVMTTGSRGLHVTVPIRPQYDFDAVRALVAAWSHALAARFSARLTTAQRKAKRGNRVYLDVQRNAYAQTAVAPYALRALPGAPVATPLAWHELRRARLTAQTFTLQSMPGRLRTRSDPWQAIAQSARSVAALQRLTKKPT